MAIVQCEQCGFSKKVPEKFVGRKVRCPQCEQPVTVAPEAEDLGLDDVIDDRSHHQEQTPRHGTPPVTEQDLAADVKPTLPGPANLLGGGLLNNIVSGLLGGAFAILFALSMAGLLAQGPMAQFFPQIVNMALISAIILGIVVAVHSGIPFAAAGPEAMTSAIVMLMLGSTTMLTALTPDALLPTALAAVALAGGICGLLLLAVGMTGTAHTTRYIPIQTIGGVLAGVGFLVARGGYTMATGGEVDLMQFFTSYMQPEFMLKWIPGLGFGALCFIVLRVLRHSVVMVGLIALGFGAAYGYLHWSGMAHADAASAGLFFTPYEPDLLWGYFYSEDFLQNINWSALYDQAGIILALAGMIAATVMLKVSEMEVASNQEIDLDREFVGLGMANMLCAAAGGMPGNLSLGRSLGNRSTGAGGTLSGILAALLCAPALLFAPKFLTYVPIFIPAGLLLYFGLSLMSRWLVDTRLQFTHKGDYSLLWLVFLLTVCFGFLVAVAVGAAMSILVTAGRYGSTSVVKHVVNGAHFRSNVDRAPAQLSLLAKRGEQIQAVSLQGFIFLGSTDSLFELLHNRLADKELLPLKFLLLDFTLISGLGSSVALPIIKLKQLGIKHDFKLVFTNVPLEYERQLENVGCALNEPESNSMTVISLDYALEWAEDHLLDEEDLLHMEQENLQSLLKPIFPEPRYIPMLMKVLQRVQVKKNRAVFSQGDPSDSMYFVESGMVTVQLELEGGKLLRLKKMGPGTVFGEMGIYTSAPRSASIIASENCVLYRLSSKVLHAVQGKKPELAASIHRFIVSLLAERVANANNKVRDLLR